MWQRRKREEKVQALFVVAFDRGSFLEGFEILN
jgi:hypothetical protein